VSVDPLFTDDTIDRKINEALQQLFPRIYRTIVDESLDTDGTRTLSITGLTIAAPRGISRVELQIADWADTDALVWVEKKQWSQTGEETIQFERAPDDATPVRLTYMAYWETLALDADITTLPDEYLPLVLYYVCGKLGEIAMRKRIRFDSFVVDTDPAKSTAADLMGVAGYDLYKFDTMIEAKKMTPLSYPTPHWRVRKREVSVSSEEL
jgi:hypothetical protein